MEKGAIRFHGLTASCSNGPTSCVRSSSRVRRRPKAAKSRRQRRTSRSRRSPIAPPSRCTRTAANAAWSLETRGITRRFSGITAVDDVSIQLHEGEILGIVGPTAPARPRCSTSSRASSSPTPARSSSRASTSRVAGRSAAPSSGWRVRSRTPASSARSPCTRRSASRSTGPSRCWDPITAMLYFPNVVLAERRLGKRADELIEMMGLDDYRDKFVSELSTGSRRIVDLACQIGIEPKVILFDEPSSGIAQRETEALGPLLAAHPRHHGREHPAHRARHAARQLRLRPHHRLRPRAGRGRRRLGAGPEPPARRRVVPRVDPRGHRAFRPEQGSSTTEVVEGARP